VVATFRILLLVGLAAPLWAQAAPTPPFKECPQVGASLSCGILIVLNANGSASVYADPSVGPYEETDDTLVGVLNNSGHTVTSLPLNGGTIQIFAFEGDGICDTYYPKLYGPIPLGCPFGATGYEGPGVSFTNINGTFQEDNTGTYCSLAGDQWSCAVNSGTGFTTGTVNFLGGIPPGGSAYFGLEEALTAAQIVVPLSTTCPTATATVNLPYSSQLTGGGGNGVYNWKLASGSLGNLALSASGLVSGTPNGAAAGTLSFSLLIGDSGGDPSVTQACTIKVAAAPLTLNCSPPGGTLQAGTAYSASCTAAGGTPAYGWTYATLPSWLSGPSSGATVTLTGTIPNPPPSSYSTTVTVTDSSTPTKQTQSQTITINVAAPTLAITCTAPSSATAGTAYSGSCTASGGTPGYTWTYATLPSWLTGGNSGTSVTLSGTPPSPPPGSYTFTVTVTDNTSPAKQTKSQSITITVAAPTLAINCTAPSSATTGLTYSGSCTASGGTPAYSWTYSNLPSWLSGGASGSPVSLSGIPPTPPPSSYTFTVTVTDKTSPANQTKSQTITINVSVPAVTGVTISQSSSSSAPNQTTLSVQFGQAATTTYTGTLSLTFNPDPGVTNVPAGYVDPAAGFPISGQSTTSLTQNFTVNSGQTSATTQFALGTVAGTWTVTLTALSGGVPSPAPSFTVSVAAAAPVITAGSVSIVFNSGNTGFTVKLSGFATTRDVASATFVFAPAAGAQLSGSSVTVPFNGQDQTQWFNTAAGQSAGGTFSLSLPFAYSGDSSALGSVSVSLTNSKSQTSAAVNGT
jgi:cytochrome c2